MWLTESLNCLLYSDTVHLAKCYQTLGMISSMLGCINEREEKKMENMMGRLSHQFLVLFSDCYSFCFMSRYKASFAQPCLRDSHQL